MKTVMHCVCTTLLSMIVSIVAPSTAPVITTGYSIDSRTVSIQWDAPPDEHHNGIIRKYIVNVTIVETGDTWNTTFSGTSAIIGSLVPSFTYQFTVTAYTVAAGPYSTVVTIVMPEDGMFRIYLQPFFTSTHVNSS